MKSKRIAVLGVLVVVALLVARFVPYHPVIVAGPAVAPGPFAVPRAVEGLRLHVFNTGANRMSSLLVGENRPWRPAPAFVIEHPSKGLVVFDTGLSQEVARDGEAAMPVPMRWLFESRGDPAFVLDAQMRTAGLDPVSVHDVILSHLHDDHTGRLDAFPSATFLAGPGTAVHGAKLGLAARWREIAVGDASTSLPPFDGTLDLYGDGSVTVIRGGGHTPEDLMLLVALPGGPVLLTGDAAVHRDWLESDDVQRIASDPERAAVVRNEIRAFENAVPGLVVVFGHDLGGVPANRGDLVRHSPDRFAMDAWPISR